ncbi:hypothetical protein HMPREF0058_1299 [Actinomyces urogenitalis DSM 15434]|uniref:Uncharacterized protein n=1 Tax=Actinomyces urogenitalis DSM 15434 TaxID=525246 RepID=C0W605_9ACTO|nr:hypothetical protein HMPREF0058_1299 [Actinomyces urogenitalis DSM 15434]
MWLTTPPEAGILSHDLAAVANPDLSHDAEDQCVRPRSEP